MKPQVLVRRRAVIDLRKARNWYESQRPGLGDELETIVLEAIQMLEKNPERHAVYYRNLRRIITSQFPYKIFYRVLANRVEIIRILHTK